MPAPAIHDPELPPTPSALDRITADPHDRKRFLKLAGVGSAGTLALFLAACGETKKQAVSTATAMATGTKTTAADVKNDLAIVNYALTLEYLETAFYTKVAKSGLFKGSDLDTIKHLQDTEQQHVDALTATVKSLGGTPAAEPMSDFPVQDQKSVLKLAATVENLGAAAYLGQAANIKSPDILAAALAIHSVEARHAAALNLLTGQSPSPDGAFAKPADMATVLAAVKPFIVA